MVLSMDYAGLLTSLLSKNTKYGGVAPFGSPIVTGNTMFAVFIGALLIILIKGLIVYLAWNSVMPYIIYSLTPDPKKNRSEIINNFKPITYTQALLFTILVLSLVR
jgi:hypothetical protein